jgi:hypothetical protein
MELADIKLKSKSTVKAQYMIMGDMDFRVGLSRTTGQSREIFEFLNRDE